MKIKTQLTFKGYSRLMFGLFYRKAAPLGMTIFGGLIIIVGTLGGLAEKPLSHTQVSMILLYGLVVVLFPLIVIKIKIRTKRSFLSNRMLQEEIVYEFREDKISMSSTTFTAEMNWAKLHKVREVKEWFLRYQSKHSMNLIPKTAFEGNLAEFETLIKSQKGLNY